MNIRDEAPKSYPSSLNSTSVLCVSVDSTFFPPSDIARGKLEGNFQGCLEYELQTAHPIIDLCWPCENSGTSHRWDTVTGQPGQPCGVLCLITETNRLVKLMVNPHENQVTKSRKSTFPK